MKNKIKNIDIILIAVMITLVLANIYIFANRLNNSNKKENIEVESKVQENSIENDDELNKLQDMEERDRMEYYFAEFIEGIEEGDYQRSYDLLYKDFKDKYFPSLEKFVQYVKNTYGDSPAFSYKDIERQGDIYVLMIDIVNVKDKTKNKSQRIVIKENDFNDFVISFQVI